MAVNTGLLVSTLTLWTAPIPFEPILQRGPIMTEAVVMVIKKAIVENFILFVSGVAVE